MSDGSVPGFNTSPHLGHTPVACHRILSQMTLKYNYLGLKSSKIVKHSLHDTNNYLKLPKIAIITTNVTVMTIPLFPGIGDAGTKNMFWPGSCLSCSCILGLGTTLVKVSKMGPNVLLWFFRCNLWWNKKYYSKFRQCNCRLWYVIIHFWLVLKTPRQYCMS